MSTMKKLGRKRTARQIVQSIVNKSPMDAIEEEVIAPQPDDFVNQDKRLLQVMKWASFYRSNPDIFVRDYLGLTLKFYQRILLVMMFWCSNFMFLGARGIAKSYTTAVFAVAKAILYPNSKICIAAPTLKQAKDTMSKIIEELRPHSKMLDLEIEKVIFNAENYSIKFRNGSIIYGVAASKTSRGKRATVLICDEFVQMKEDVIDTVLKKFLNVVRQTGYLHNPRYAHLQERGQELYLSSCWFKSHWSWELVKTYAVGMVDSSKKYFMCGLPYQLSIKEGLLLREVAEDEMAKETFSQMRWDMEMECLFWGESESSFYKYEQLCNARKVVEPVYPSNIYPLLPKSCGLKRPLKKQGEIRILTVDVAIMASKNKENDASAIFLLQLFPNTTGQYIRHASYAETSEGGHTLTQALRIRKLFNSLDCDYLVIDANGVGSGIYDMLVTDLLDEETGVTYDALQCTENDKMATRYQGKSPCPPKVIFPVKADAKWNNNCAIALRDCIQTGKLKLLANEQEFDEYLYSENLDKLDEIVKTELKLPIVHTTLTVNELVALSYTVHDGAIQISETSGHRKDRYSALSYGNYYANILEGKSRVYREEQLPFSDFMRKPKFKGAWR